MGHREAMSQSAPPPYGAPVPPQQPPRRRRPRWWWFVVGGALVGTAIAVGIGLFVWTISAFLSTDATVDADGRSHEVSVGVDGERMLWLEDGFGQSCEIVDRATGQPVALRPVGGEFTRSDGAGDFGGAARFDPGSGRLQVTCTGSEGAVLIGPAPRIGAFVGGIFAMILIPLGLGTLGLLVLIVTGVLFVTGAPRRQPAP